MNPLIEKWFHPIESEFPNLQKQIKDHIAEINQTGKASNIHRRYRPILCEYLYINLIRVPKVFDHLKEESLKFYEKLEKDGYGNFNENDAQIAALRTLIRIGKQPETNIMNEFLKRHLSVIFFPRTKVNIVTSDTPVVLSDRTRPPGLAHMTTEVYFPLDSSCILKLWGRGDTIFMEKQHYLAYSNDYNRLMGKTAFEEVYSARKETLEWIAAEIGMEINEKHGHN
jgi:uncharacterized protein DUF4238